jgi:serralysin
MNGPKLPELRTPAASAARVALLLVRAGCDSEPRAEAARDVVLDQRQSPLILNVHNGADDIWTQSERVNLTYCVSTSFGEYYPRAVQEMYEATQDWEGAAYVEFIHQAEHDTNCAYPAAPVLFTVEWIFLGTGEAGAESFPPSYVHEGQYHYLGIALPAYDTLDRSVDQRTSRGTFSHELGHILGFRHEHLRPEAAQAPFDYVCHDEPVSEGYDRWRTIDGGTEYDPSSAMHYGTGSCGPLKDYALTATDRAAARFVYPAPTRCEVWAGSTELAVTDLTAPASASDGEAACEAFAVDNHQRDGAIYSNVERHPDHFRAILTVDSNDTLP